MKNSANNNAMEAMLRTHDPTERLSFGTPCTRPVPKGTGFLFKFFSGIFFDFCFIVYLKFAICEFPLLKFIRLM